MRLLALGWIVFVPLLAMSSVPGCDDRECGTPGGSTVGPGESALHAARLDAATRASVNALQVELVSLRHAGWDGCLGVQEPGKACTQLFVGGYVAIFQAGGSQTRYHFAGDRWVGPVDAAKASDGSPVPPAMQTDFNAVLAAYVRHDLALRLQTFASAAVVVAAIVPVTFPDACMGWERPGQEVCAQVVTPGAIVLLSMDGPRFRYHVTELGIVATDFTDGRATVQPDRALVGVQQAMRENLAGRLGAETGSISVRSYREVTWPDGCLGVTKPGSFCTLALVDGFLAKLSDAGGKEYRYHGAGDRFVAADFEPGARIDEPLPPG